MELSCLRTTARPLPLRNCAMSWRSKNDHPGTLACSEEEGGTNNTKNNFLGTSAGVESLPGAQGSTVTILLTICDAAVLGVMRIYLPNFHAKLEHTPIS